MSGHDSWEDEQDAQEDLSRRTEQNLNLNTQRGSFQPGASYFQPGAQSFQPAGAPQLGSYQSQQEYGGYPQYAQLGYSVHNHNLQQHQQHGAFYQYSAHGYGSTYGTQPQYQVPSQNYQPQQTLRIAKRPSEAENSPTPAPAGTPVTTKTLDSKPSGVKVLSIGSDSLKSKIEPPRHTKMLSIGGETKIAPATKSSTMDNIDPQIPDAGAKVAAVKAIEKTGEIQTEASRKTSPSPSSGRSSPSRADQKTAAREADLVAKEQAADVDEDTLQEMYGKEHVNVIFLGHVDAGKSTLGGSILYACGMVDERTMDKYRREAKDAGTESWYLSWALDLTKEERSKGKTVEVGRGFFETERRRYSILDAPGHKTFVPNMIGGASQADVGVLVISARKGEYETGFEKGGQTREHAMLAKTQGVNKLIVVVNKMDDQTVQWSQERYDECTKKLTLFLKGLGYNPKTDLTFMPVSGQMTLNIREPVPKDICPWYDGPSLLDYLDSMQTLERKVNAPFMMPISAKYRDLGTMVEGKIESGVIKKGVTYLMMPNKVNAPIAALYGETEDEIDAATCGEQVRIRLRGIEEEDIMPGFVLCSPKRPVHCVPAFEAQIVLLDIKSILSAGFNCVMHVHSATEEVTFDALLHKLEKGTNRKSKKAPGFATRGMSIIARLRITGLSGNVCVEKFEDYPQLGRFTLRDQVSRP